MEETDRRQRACTEASRWLVRLQTGDAGREEREEFVEWLRESQLHVAEMLRVAQVRGLLENFDAWTRISTEGAASEGDKIVELPRRAVGPKGGPRNYTKWLLVAASIAVTAIGLTFAIPLFRGHVVETDRGERREVVLSDGSIIQVDPETRLRVKYDDARRIFLERGRALFRVAKSPGRPFLVQASGTTIRAVGTVFGVDAHDERVLVTVVEGRVAVSAAQAAQRNTQSQPTSQNGAPESVLVSANEQTATLPGAAPKTVRSVDSGRELAWAQGRLVFQNDSIDSAIALFNRYNTVNLKVTDAVLARRHVSGVFNASDPEAFIAFLQTVMPLEIVRDGDRSILIAPSKAH